MTDGPGSDIDREPTEPGQENPDILMTTVAIPLGGYTLWEFQETGWVLKKDQSREGHGPPSPPSVPGRFRGQFRTLMSVPLKPRKTD